MDYCALFGTSGWSAHWGGLWASGRRALSERAIHHHQHHHHSGARACPVVYFDLITYRSLDLALCHHRSPLQGKSAQHRVRWQRGKARGDEGKGIDVDQSTISEHGRLLARDLDLAVHSTQDWWACGGTGSRGAKRLQSSWRCPVKGSLRVDKG